MEVKTPIPPRTTVLGNGCQLNPTRGITMLGFVACRVVRPFAALNAYHSPPSTGAPGAIPLIVLEEVLKFCTAGSKVVSLPLTSDHPVRTSQRRPRLTVRLGL